MSKQSESPAPVAATLADMISRAVDAGRAAYGSPRERRPLTPCITAEVMSVPMIAAAPELLAALRSIIEWQDDDREGFTPAQRDLMIRNAARSAIAKATGGGA